MRVKALHDCCVVKEGVVTRVRKHNTNLLNQQTQYKEAVRILNQELQEVKEKLTEVSCQNDKLHGEVTALGEKLQTAGADAIRDFKVSQSFIDSCAKYYGTGFEISFGRSSRPSRSWTCLGLPWMMEMTALLSLTLLRSMTVV